MNNQNSNIQIAGDNNTIIDKSKKVTNLNVSFIPKQISTEDKIEGYKYSFSYYIPIIANVVAFIADFFSIISFLNTYIPFTNMDYNKFSQMIACIFFLVILLGATILLTNINCTLFKKNRVRKHIRIKNKVYKIKLSKCPICGDSLGGKLIISLNNDEKQHFYVCTKDNNHKWPLDTSEIVEYIQDNENN